MRLTVIVSTVMGVAIAIAAILYQINPSKKEGNIETSINPCRPLEVDGTRPMLCPMNKALLETYRGYRVARGGTVPDAIDLNYIRNVLKPVLPSDVISFRLSWDKAKLTIKSPVITTSDKVNHYFAQVLSAMVSNGYTDKMAFDVDVNVNYKKGIVRLNFREISDYVRIDSASQKVMSMIPRPDHVKKFLPIKGELKHVEYSGIPSWMLSVMNEYKDANPI